VGPLCFLFLFFSYMFNKLLFSLGFSKLFSRVSRTFLENTHRYFPVRYEVPSIGANGWIFMLSLFSLV
jgi:hypothetical protein